MTQFSSKPPFNDDPFPYLNPTCPDHKVCRRKEDWPEYYDPRPEYDRPQHNPTNPILTEFRRIVEETGNGVYVTAWMFSGDLIEDWESHPLDQWHHAMDVLERILSNYKEVNR